MSPRTPDPHTRAQLVEAAAALIDQGGPESVSVRSVAERVGTSTMAVYTHFGGKDALLLAVVLEGFARLADWLGGVEPTDDPVADLLALGQAYRANALANPHLYSAMFGRRHGSLTELCDEDLLTTYATFQVLVDACARCIDAGRFPVPAGHDPDTYAAEVAARCWAASHGAVSLELGGYFLDEPSGRACFEGTQQSLVSGLAAGDRAPA